MSQFEYLLTGTYVTIFSAPILSLIFWKRFASLNNFLVMGTASMIAVGFVAFSLGFSFRGILVDATCFFVGYVLVCISALKLACYRNVMLSFVGACLFLPACGIAVISVGAFLGYCLLSVTLKKNLN